MSNYTFASMPSVSIARSKFERTQPHNSSWNLGELVVLGFDEVIPGSTHKIDLGSLIRMSTPIAPIMDDIQCDIYSFFVPMRLTWEHWKQFMGESDQAGISTVTYTIPKIDISGNPVAGSVINTLADDLGVPAISKDSNNVINELPPISILPFRGFALLYNRWFRNQNVEAPIPVYLGDTLGTNELVYLAPGITIKTGSITSVDYGTARYTAYKLPDYFTSALPYAQKGQPVSILTDPLPVVTGDDHRYTGVAMKLEDASSGTLFTTPSLLAVNSNSALRPHNATPDILSGQLAPSNLWARCVNTINDLRFAFQLQKALEKDALYGSRYWEVLRAHYAVTSPDATLQDPELLGHVKFDINMSQVLETTGFTSASNTNLGTPGANSVTANKSHLFTASFVEHGYIYHVLVCRQKRRTYSQGLNKLWTRDGRWDFYHPVFANIGMQEIKNYQIAISPSSNNGTFGFQTAWDEYRFLPPYNSGLLNPVRSNSLDYWTLAENFATLPTLGTTFLKEDRSNLVRALTTGVTGPDFIGSFYIKDTVVNPMPLYSIPGFADHH